jgi:hypothetical protein
MFLKNYRVTMTTTLDTFDTLDTLDTFRIWTQRAWKC